MSGILSGHAFINHKIIRKEEKNGLQKCGQHYRLKRKEKFRLLRIWENPEEELRLNIRVRRCRKTGQSERMVGVCVHGNAENAKQRDGKILVPFSRVRCVRREAAAASKKNICGTPHDSASQNSCRKTAAAVRRRGLQDAVIATESVPGHLGGYLSFQWIFIAVSQNGKTPSRCAMRRTRTEGPRKAEPCEGGMFYTAQSGIWQSVWMEWCRRRIWNAS